MNGNRPAPHKGEALTGTAGAPQPVAVIDVGTTSIRMAVAEIDPRGGVRHLEALSQPISLGKDTFTTGSISRQTTEAVVEALKRYAEVLREYQITDPSRIRVVATSAVREASNQLAFLDRVYAATGLVVKPLDEAEVARITYSGVQPLLEDHPDLATATVLVMEVGGGTTEFLVVQGDEVVLAISSRLGSLRLQHMIPSLEAPATARRLMENQIRRFLEEMGRQVPKAEGMELVALGGDVRLAAHALAAPERPDGLVELPREALERFAREIWELSIDDLVDRFHITYTEAGTLGPAILAYLETVRLFDLPRLFVAPTNLRDGLLHEMALGSVWTEHFRQQVVRSAIQLGRRFGFDEAHARHVASLSQQLFRQLQGEHGLEPKYEVLLFVAALLHEIGRAVNQRAYHKHSMYVIRNSELFGLSQQELLLVALIARYHRRATPQPTHEGYADLPREQRIAVCKLGALLRVAVALDESRSQRVQDIVCLLEKDRCVIEVPGVDDLSLEQLALRNNGQLFQQIFGRDILARPRA